MLNITQITERIQSSNGSDMIKCLAQQIKGHHLYNWYTTTQSQLRLQSADTNTTKHHNQQHYKQTRPALQTNYERTHTHTKALFSECHIQLANRSTLYMHIYTVSTVQLCNYLNYSHE